MFKVERDDINFSVVMIHGATVKRISTSHKMSGEDLCALLTQVYEWGRSDTHVVDPDPPFVEVDRVVTQQKTPDSDPVEVTVKEDRSTITVQNDYNNILTPAQPFATITN